jgi:hypothetical protein
MEWDDRVDIPGLENRSLFSLTAALIFPTSDCSLWWPFGYPRPQQSIVLTWCCSCTTSGSGRARILRRLIYSCMTILDIFECIKRASTVALSLLGQNQEWRLSLDSWTQNAPKPLVAWCSWCQSIRRCFKMKFINFNTPKVYYPIDI